MACIFCAKWYVHLCYDTLPCVTTFHLILIISNNTTVSFYIVFSRAISRSHHTPEVDIRFQIDGDNVCGSSTFSQLGVENGGVISWVLVNMVVVIQVMKTP